MEEVFPGVSGLRLSTDEEGLPFSLRIVKGEGVPIHLVPEDTPGASVVAVKRVDELGYYNIGHTQLAKKLGITEPRLRAALWHLGIGADEEYCKEIRIASSHWKRYSQKALHRLEEELESMDLDEVWAEYRDSGYPKLA